MDTVKKLIEIIIIVMGLILLPTTLILSQEEWCQGDFDFDIDVDGTDAFWFKHNFGRGTLLYPCPPDGPAPVEWTGQSFCYNDYDDAWMNKGVTWPIPRFKDNDDGTVKDNMTGLIWLKNADCQDAQANNWYDALNVYFLHGDCGGTILGICGLSDGSCGGDWRLPNIKELLSLVDYGRPEIILGMGQLLPENHPFLYVKMAPFWSSTTHNFADAENMYAYQLSFIDGSVTLNHKLNPDTTYGLPKVWPVRGGRSTGTSTTSTTTIPDCQMGINCIAPAQCCEYSLMGSCYCEDQYDQYGCAEFFTPVEHCNQTSTTTIPDCQMGINCIAPAQCCEYSLIGGCYCEDQFDQYGCVEFFTPVEHCNQL